MLRVGGVVGGLFTKDLLTNVVLISSYTNSCLSATPASSAKTASTMNAATGTVGTLGNVTGVVAARRSCFKNKFTNRGGVVVRCRDCPDRGCGCGCCTSK